MSNCTLPNLPYAYDALEPHLSKTTLSLHHQKHHKGYLDKLQKLIEGTEYERTDLLTIVKKSWINLDMTSVFNNAAQAWNRDFFWHSMSPQGGGIPDGPVLDLIIQSFGTYVEFKNAFLAEGMQHFGSGWIWLVLKNGLLFIEKTSNASTPVVEDGKLPILVCDVWEHSYYLEYQNRRLEYLEVFLNHLVSWEAAKERLEP